MTAPAGILTVPPAPSAAPIDAPPTAAEVATHAYLKTLHGSLAAATNTINEHERRLKAVEAAKPAAPSPLITVAIDATQEAALKSLTANQGVILRGPTLDIVAVVA